MDIRNNRKILSRLTELREQFAYLSDKLVPAREKKEISPAVASILKQQLDIVNEYVNLFLKLSKEKSL